ncbi:MAG: hypothetical protein LBC63_06370 [Holophagales bacterium]|jgi:ABC-type glycerol-3-phosphate transport system substrate-binding protein|nr:hypothetical protein [Holophagales bacterium]
MNVKKTLVSLTAAVLALALGALTCGGPSKTPEPVPPAPVATIKLTVSTTFPDATKIGVVDVSY